MWAPWSPRAFAVQYAFGLVVHSLPDGAADVANAYRVAFAGLIGLEVLAFLWFLVYRRAEEE